MSVVAGMLHQVFQNHEDTRWWDATIFDESGLVAVYTGECSNPIKSFEEALQTHPEFEGIKRSHYSDTFHGRGYQFVYSVLEEGLWLEFERIPVQGHKPHDFV